MKGAAPWKLPPKVKLFEALGALADLRITRTSPPPTSIPEDASSSTLDGTKLPKPTEVNCFYDSAAAVFSVKSSNGDKAYEVRLQQRGGQAGAAASFAVACNDNGSMFQGYLGYPALAVLTYYGILLPSRLKGVGSDVEDSRREIEAAVAALRGVKWKDIATRHKNNWDKVVADALGALDQPSSALVSAVVDSLYEDLQHQVLQKCERFSSKAQPPKRPRE